MSEGVRYAPRSVGSIEEHRLAQRLGYSDAYWSYLAEQRGGLKELLLSDEVRIRVAMRAAERRERRERRRRLQKKPRVRVGFDPRVERMVRLAERAPERRLA